MRNLLRWLVLLTAATSLLPRGVRAEGSKQLTPNTPATNGLALTDPANTRSGFLTHDVNALGGATNNTSQSFLKPFGFSFTNVTFSEDHRMLVRVKAGETLLYGVHRLNNIIGDGDQRNLILTLRYGAGVGTQVQRTVLLRDSLTAGTNQSLLIDTQNGVIDNAAQAQAGPLPAAGGYQPLTYVNTTGADQDFYLEFTQRGEGTPGNYDATFSAAQRYSTYDYWDLTVRNTGGVEQPGRLRSKQWSFSAGITAGRFSSTFELFPLIPDASATNRFYVKRFELAGLNPQNFFRFTTNSRGTTASATDYIVSRRSQTLASGFTDYPEFENFVQNPDAAIWPSTAPPTFAVRSVTPFCGPGGNGQLAFTTTSTVAGVLAIVVDLNGTPGYQPGTRDAVVEKVVPVGTSTVVWDGLDGLGAPVPSGTAVTLNFKSGAAPVNFPVVDAENNENGFRIQNVRPTTGFDQLYWDDTNLSATLFPVRSSLGGVLSTGGVHNWGTASGAGQPTTDAGNDVIINTYSFGNTNAVDRTFTLTVVCDGDGDGITNATDIDLDNDGISNTEESSGVNPSALTANGVPTYLDAAYVHPTLGAFRDVNGDGVNDVFDLDLDGLPNFFDIDADGDGITDVVEANASGAAVAGYNATTGRITGAVGANGMPDAAETAAESGATRFALTNTDGNGRPDFLDIDADNDGIPDNTEGQATAAYRAPAGLDTDGDGLDNTYDPTPGGAVAAGTALPLTNTDGTDQPDYRDTNSDNDARLDSVEGWDTDNDGVANTLPSGLDADQDGLDDAYDTINTTTTTFAGNAQNGRLPAFYPDVNKPGGDRDWRQAFDATTVAGTVFEDVNYGGGLGRNQGTAGTSGRPNATVELYNSAGNFVATTTTNGSGQYSFGNIAAGTYTVRVVNATVSSSRNTGSVAGLVPVQTFVRQGGTADDVNRVGGEVPSRVDAAANTGAQTLAQLTAGNATPQSVTSVTVAAVPVPVNTVDFGFNFDVITNTNDAGQGSLRQFILNSNALPNAGLDQVASSTGGTDPVAGTETSIFMIPRGAATAGIRSTVASGLSAAGVAVITPLTQLPAITGTNTAIDGRTQTQNVGNTNNATLGTGGFVGAAGTLALGQLNGPEVQVQGTSAIAIGLDVAAGGANTAISGLAVLGFGNVGNDDANASIRVGSTGVRIFQNVIGTTATAFVAPATLGNSDGVRVVNGSNNVVISNNLIGFNGGKGITIVPTVGGSQVTGNELRSNGQSSSNWDGLDNQGGGGTVSGNLAVNNAGIGFDSFISNGGNTTTNNSSIGNGRGTAANGPVETPGFRVFGVNNTITGNLVQDNYGSGIMVVGGAGTTVISQNVISGNGAVAAINGTAASGAIGIDLLAGGQSDLAGVPPYVTLNSAVTGGANGLVNYPVFTSATLVGTNLVLRGFAKPNATIELFLAQANALAGPSATVGNNFGQGRTFLTTLAAGATGGASYAGPINGFDQGSDTNANAFVFTVALTPAQQALVLAGTRLTATSTLAGATSEFSGNVPVTAALTGFVYEDPNYGGGLGRNRATAGTVVRPGAIVELYETATGNFVGSAVTDATGQYVLPAVAGTAYTVRVVNASVTSGRPGATSTGNATTGFVSGQVGVQTFNGSTDRVGGEYPGRTDAGPNTTNANLSTLTAGGTAAQSLASLSAAASGATTGPDFGFNFSTVTNTNATGQGSLAQFIGNANALGGEASLAQSGSRVDAAGTTVALPAQKESSIFMIPNGTAVGGLRAYNAGTSPGTASQLQGAAANVGGTVALIVPTASLTLAGANAGNTVIDGSTQTANIGNTNAGTAANATATTVGVDGVALAGIQKPEVEISGSTGGNLLEVNAANATVRGLAIHGGGNTIGVGNGASATGYVLENLLVGPTADGTRPATNVSPGTGVYVYPQGGVGTVQNNLIGFANASGLGMHNGIATVGVTQILGNFFVKNGFVFDGGDGISFGDGGQPSGPANVAGNLFANNNSSAIQFEIGSTALTTVTNNTVLNSGTIGGDPGSVTSSLEGGGIVYLSRNGVERGTQADVISRNVVTGSQASGIVVGYGQQNVTISQNNTNGNGSVGIDLIPVNQSVSNGTAVYGNGDGVTINDGNNPGAATADQPNKGIDFPILTSATIVGSNLVVRGIARPGVTVELFLRDTDAGNFGEGQTYLGGGVENGAGDGITATTTINYSGTINGLNQGADNSNTAREFTFTVPIGSLSAGQLAALNANGLTATATLAGAGTSEFSGRVLPNAAPIAQNATNASIPVSAGATVLNPNLSGTAFGTLSTGAANAVASYTIATVPGTGTLTYNNGAGVVPVTAGTVITAAQLASLSFTPTPGFAGASTSFTYTVTDGNAITSTTNRTGAGAATAGPATYTIPLAQVADVVATITGPATLTGNVPTATNAYSVTFANGGPSVASGVSQVVTLPVGATLNAAQVAALTAGAVYTAPANPGVSGSINFTNATGSSPTLASGTSNTYTFGLVPYNGLGTAGSAVTPAVATATIATTSGQNGATANDTRSSSVPVSFVPVPAYVTNAAIASTNGQTAIAPLTAADQDGTIASFTLATVPNGTQGLLYYNNAANGTSGTYVLASAGQVLTPAQATTLRFDPSGGFAGNATFSYTATDNAGNPSTTANNGGTAVPGPAVFTIPITSNGISANNDSNVVPINTPTPGNVLLNDSNPNGNGLLVTTTGTATAGGTTTTFVGGTATTANGTVTIAADGSYTYTPNPGYLGNDAFAYQVCTSAGTGCVTALVSIRVYDPGTACSSGTGPNLFANADFNQGNTGFGTDYNFVSAAANAATPGGNSGLIPENTYAVTNNTNIYHPSFRGLGRAAATNPADQFLAINGSVNVQRLYAQTVPVLPNRYYTFSAYFNNLLPPGSNNGLPELGFVINGESISGSRVIPESPDRWVQASDVWYSGSSTSATFEIRNRSIALGGNDIGIDDLYMGTCNLPPVANNDLRTTPFNTSITTGFNALANDTDGDGTLAPATIRFSNGTQTIAVTGGTFTVDNAGNVTFVPTAGFTGTASATYTVKDNDNGTSNPGTVSVTVGPPPIDLATALSAASNPTNAGATQTLTVTASNNGPATAGNPATATNVVQTLQLPAGLTGVSFGSPAVGAGATLAAGSPSYNATTGLVTFPTIASQAPGTTGNVAFTVSYPTPASGPYPATATVSAANGETNTANNTAALTLNVTPQFDLVTTISGPTTALAGNALTYTVTSANNGPSNAPNAVQTVTGLPLGLSQVFVSGGGTYNPATGTVTFPAVASFPVGQPVSNTISFVAPAAGTSLVPVAVISPSTTGAGDTAPANNTAGLNGVSGGSTTTTAPPAGQLANVRTTVTTSAASVAPGTPVTVTATYANDGPNAALTVAPTVTLAPGLTVTGLPAGASYNSTTGVLTLPVTASLAAGGSQAYTFGFVAPATGPVNVTSAVSSATADPVMADNVATTVVNVVPTADVATAISGPAAVLAGQPVAYDITTRNNGAAPALGLVQTATLPAGLPVATLQLNGATGTQAGNVITFGGGATYDVTTGLLTLPAVAAAPSGFVATNSVRFLAPAGSATLLATAAVRSNTPDGVPANNTASASTTVTPSVDVRTLVSGPASVPVFSPMTYSVTTINDGPSVAPTVVPTLQLPTNLTNVALPTGASYNSTTGLVTFATITNLSSGAAVTNSVSFTMPDVAQVTALAASAVSGVSDRNVDNNRVSITTVSATPTDRLADLSATVVIGTAASPGTALASVAAGTPLTITATYANGPASTSDAATGVRAVLALPAGLPTTGPGAVVVSNGGSYNPATGLVTWPVVATLLPSDAAGYAPLVYTVSFNAPGTDPLVATASVSSALSDPTPANNQQTRSVSVTPVADLVTTVAGPAQAPAAGGTVSYAVTTVNNGPSAAAASTTTVVLPLPAGATYFVNGGPAQTYNGTSVTLPAVASQQPGANNAVTNTITFTSPSGAPGTTFAVSATASTTTPESSTANNPGNATTTRANQAPVARDVTNALQAPEGNTAGPLPISPLAATDADGTVASFQLTSLPLASQGVLFYNNAADGTSGTYVALPIGQNLTPAQANTLRFDPAPTFAGNVTFQYTATDNLGAVSQPATYTVPVSQDVPSVYTNAPVKGGAGNPYLSNDPIANVFDPNGGTANGATVTDTGTRTVTLTPTSGAGSAPALAATTAGGIAYPANPTNALPAGISLNPTTGQLFVSNPALLVPGAYQVNITTVDVYGGVTTQPVRFVIGGGGPVANNDATSTLPGVPVTLNALANDTPAGASTDPSAINPATVDLDPNTPGIQQGPVTVPGGTFSVNAAGVVTFAPNPGFVGTATIPYTVSNNAGTASNQANIAVTVAPAVADLATTLAVSANPAIAGSPLTLTVTTTNNTPGATATGVAPTATIPAGLPISGPNAPLVNGSAPTGSSGGNATYPGGASYNPTTGLVTFPVTPTLAGGTNVANTVTFNAPNAGPVALQGGVSSTSTDPNAANNTATLSVPVTPRTDLATTIVGPATAPTTGNLVSYAITTANNGPTAAPGVVQSVQLPTGLTNVFVSNGGYYNPTAAPQTLYVSNGSFTATNPGGGATAYTVPAGGVVFLPIGLASGQTVANSVSFPAPAAGTALAPVATVPTTNDANPANNTATAPSLTVAPATAALANTNVAIVASTANAAPGTPVNYTVTVRNGGPDAATSVATTVNVGPGLTVTNLPSGASYNPTTGIVTFALVPTLAANATAPALTFTVTAPAVGPLVATASVSSPVSDPNSGDNTATAVTTVTPRPDVVSVVTGPASVPAGQPATFVLTSTNNGPGTATGVQPALLIPAGLPISGPNAPVVNGSAPTGTSGGNATYPDGSTYNPTTGVVTFPLLPTLGQGGSVANTVTIPQAPVTDPLVVTGTTTTTSADPTPANNTSTVNTAVTPVADLVVSIAGPASAIQGQPVTYAVTTLNNGPSVATGNTLTTVQLPAGLTGVVVRDPAGNIVPNTATTGYNPATGVVTLPALANLPSGSAGASTSTISFVAPASSQANLTATTTAPAGVRDPNAANNAASISTPLTPATGLPADISTTLVPNVTAQTAGQPVVYTLTTTNNGPNPASNVTQQVQLPAGLSGVNAPGGTYDPATGLVTYPATAGPLANGNAIVRTITVTAPGTGPLVASATSGASNPDPTPANNVAQATNVIVTPSADVVTTLAGPTAVTPGAPVTYVVTTTNNGPSPAANVQPTATIPAGLPISGPNAPLVNGQAPTGTAGGNATYPDGSTYNPTTGVVTFPAIGTLPTGQPITNTVTLPAPATPYTVAAGSTTTTPDPNPANNTAPPLTVPAGNTAPVANNVVNTAQAPQSNTAGPLIISSLSATDANNNGLTYTVLSVPPTSQGLLSYDNGGVYTPVLVNTVLTPAQAASLQFDPNPNFSGNVTFTYTATDNGAPNPAASPLTSNVATYTIPVAADIASRYVVNAPKGLANAYLNGDEIARVFDFNGGRATGPADPTKNIFSANPPDRSADYSSGVADNGTRSVTTNAAGNALLAGLGLTLNATTGRITVTDRTLLAAGTYTLSITTVDVFGGVTTQPVTFTIGTRPLPVELLAFEAKARANRDADLTWRTASERNNARFDVERSLDGRRFEKFAEVAGQGSKPTPTDYALTDADAARRAALVYYRLVQVDADGTRSFSPVRTVLFTAKAPAYDLGIYPNPAPATTTLDLRSLPTGSFRVALYDATGRLVRSLEATGGLTQTLDLTNLAAGAYQVYLTGTAPDGTALKLSRRLTKD